MIRIWLSRELHPVCSLGCRVDEDSTGSVHNSQVNPEVAPGDMDERKLFVDGGNVKRGLVSQNPLAIGSTALECAKIHTAAIARDRCHAAALGPRDFSAKGQPDEQGSTDLLNAY